MLSPDFLRGSLPHSATLVNLGIYTKGSPLCLLLQEFTALQRKATFGSWSSS